MSKVIENSRCDSDQALVMVMRRSGCDRVEGLLGVPSLISDGMSMFVARAKMEKMRLASEPNRTASSMIRACNTDDAVFASSGAASLFISRSSEMS